MFKLDLHLHSRASRDSTITAQDLRTVLNSQVLDCIAITDQNRIDFAKELWYEFNERIIIGEQIATRDGHIIGLYLNNPIKAGMSAVDTVAAIKEQKGLVYIPFPFETYRKGLHPEIMEQLVEEIDIIEVCNGRAFLQNHSAQTVVWARLNHTVGVASSDAHSRRTLGKTYTLVSQIPTRQTLLQQLERGTPITTRPGLRDLLYPKLHKVRSSIRKDRD